MIVGSKRWLRTYIVLLTVWVVACGGSSPSLPQAPSPIPSLSGPQVCFSFSPPRAEASNDAQRVTVQVVTAGPSCSWAATEPLRQRSGSHS